MPSNIKITHICTSGNHARIELTIDNNQIILENVELNDFLSQDFEERIFLKQPQIRKEIESLRVSIINEKQPTETTWNHLKVKVESKGK